MQFAAEWEAAGSSGRGGARLLGASVLSWLRHGSSQARWQLERRENSKSGGDEVDKG